MIRIDEHYVIDADQYCYTLFYDTGKVKVDKDGKSRKVRDALGYYGTLDKAVQALFDLKLKEITSEGEKSLSDALTEVRGAFCELRKVIEDAIPNVEVIIR